MDNKENKFDLAREVEAMQEKENEVKAFKERMKELGYVSIEEEKEEKVDVKDEVDEVKEEKKERITKNRANRFVAGLLAGATLVVVAGGGGYLLAGCEKTNAKGNNSPDYLQTNERILEDDESANTENIEIKELISSRAQIEAERTYSFSQVIGRVNSYPELVTRDGLKYWDVNESAGQITVTRTYGELHENNPHQEKVSFEFYPNDEQAMEEWDVLDLRENLPSGAFWIKTDSTGGKVKVEFFDENGKIVKEHDGEMVMVSWKDTNGQTREAIQFKDSITGETRPPSFQIFEMSEFENGQNPKKISYPYSTAKVTFEPTPGSYMQLVTGPTVKYGPDHDQGFGFYLWENAEDLSSQVIQEEKAPKSWDANKRGIFAPGKRDSYKTV